MQRHITEPTNRRSHLPSRALIAIALLGTLSCNPRNHIEPSNIYQYLLQLQTFEQKCGSSNTPLLLNTTLQGTVMHQGWNYYKFQPPVTNDAIFLLTPASATEDVDLAIGSAGQDVGTGLPSSTKCTGWDRCSSNPAGFDEIIAPVHVTIGGYRCIGVYGRNCAAGSCSFTLNGSWYVKP